MEEKTIKVPAIISVGDFASSLGLPVSKVIAELMKNGVMATINENIDYETAEIVADFLGFTVEPEEVAISAPNVLTIEGKNLISRPPVIAVLGHVDHGKTSLLDKIRETNVVAKESGGITQHIGAYQVEVKGKKITFLDTPGHEAFEAMRQHGAQITDIAILIVAADDGIKPQTTEAIKHIQGANTPFLVAVNKIDKPDADPMRVKKQFTEIGLVPQDWGGQIEFVEISSKSGEGIDTLLDTLIVMADLMELKADPEASAQGVVIESRLEIGKGPVATILLQNGKLEPGDWITVGETWGRVKAMEDENGKRLKEATAGQAVKISGLKEVPQVAEFLQEFESEKEARDEVTKSQKLSHVKKLSTVKKTSLEALASSIAASKKNELNLVVKADVVGSLEAIKESLLKLSNPDVAVKFVGEGVGSVSESDIQMAAVSDKIVISFKVGSGAGVESVAKGKGVKILNYDVIYELIDDVKKLVSDLMPIERIEIPVGVLKVVAIFKNSPNKAVVGGKVEDGRAEGDVSVRVKRNGEVVENYKSASIHRGTEEVPSCPVGNECGVGFNQKVTIEPGDVLEFYRVEEKKKTI